MRTLLCAIAAALLAATASPSTTRAADAARVTAAKQNLERGMYAKTPDLLLQTRAEFEAMSTAEPKSALLHYWVAVADWRLAPRLLEKKPQADRFVKDGLKHADRALELDPKLAEAVAVRASLMGISIQIDPSTMMTVGMELESTMQRAITMAPDNPRVVLLEAIGTLHKPEFVGGGAEPALARFKKSQELFAAEIDAKTTAKKKTTALQPDWGQFEAYAWAGRSAVKLGDKEAARGYYATALEIQPENGWVKHVLLPELDAPAATPAPESGTTTTPKTTSGQ